MDDKTKWTRRISLSRNALHYNVVQHTVTSTERLSHSKAQYNKLHTVIKRLQHNYFQLKIRQQRLHKLRVLLYKYEMTS